MGNQRDLSSVTVSDACSDIVELGYSPYQLFGGSLSVLLGQLLVLASLEMYNRRNQLEAGLFESKYGEPRSWSQSPSASHNPSVKQGPSISRPGHVPSVSGSEVELTSTYQSY